jgi:hypothetical protein
MFSNVWHNVSTATKRYVTQTGSEDCKLSLSLHTIINVLSAAEIDNGCDCCSPDTGDEVEVALGTMVVDDGECL